MRILMLAQFYPPTVGGEEQHVHDLSHALAERGHRVAVATLWHPGLPEFELDGSVAVYRLRGLTQRATWLYKDDERRHAPPLPDPETAWGLREVMQREQPEIVHAHNWLIHSYLPLEPLHGARLVITLHDYSLVCVQKRLMRFDAPCDGPGLRKCLACAAHHYGRAKGSVTYFGNQAMSAWERRAVDLFLPVSKAVAEGSRLDEHGLPYQVIPNLLPEKLLAVDEQAGAHPAPPELQRLPAGDFLLFVGDLSADKGVHVLLAAYDKLRESEAELPDGLPPLVVIGRRFKGTADELPPGVIALGRIPHAAVMQAWRRCTIALAPSVWAEPFGIVALEAMVAGKPLVASNTGGLADTVIDGETGLLVPPGDADALAAGIRQLLLDPQLRERLGQVAAQRAAEYRASSVAQSVERAYAGVLGDKAVHTARRESLGRQEAEAEVL
ncbi:MAG: glycosyltransferase family 4 protein [Caldilineaceae bacterium]